MPLFAVHLTIAIVLFLCLRDLPWEAEDSGRSPNARSKTLGAPRQYDKAGARDETLSSGTRIEACGGWLSQSGSSKAEFNCTGDCNSETFRCSRKMCVSSLRIVPVVRISIVASGCSFATREARQGRAHARRTCMRSSAAASFCSFLHEPARTDLQHIASFDHQIVIVSRLYSLNLPSLIRWRITVTPKPHVEGRLPTPRSFSQSQSRKLRFTATRNTTILTRDHSESLNA